MIRKLSCLCLALILCLMMTAHAEQTENPMDMTGYWLDSWSGRAHLTITFDGEKHKAVVHWADSAFAHVEWTMTGLFAGGQMNSTDCVKRYVYYDESGAREDSVLYAGQPASLTLTDSAILWSEPEDAGADCRFERYDEIDLNDVFNPEHYAHLYVTGAELIAGTPCVSGCLGTIHENGSIEGFDLRESLMLPLSSECSVRLKDGSSDLIASKAEGFYAILRLNEKGEVVRLLYNEDQPDAPVRLKEEVPVVEVMVAPAPPSGR